MARFKHIDKADQYKADKTLVDAWRNKSTADKQAAFEATQNKTGNLKTAVAYELGYIIPFGVLLASKIFLAIDYPKTAAAVAGKTESDPDLFTNMAALLGERVTKIKPSGAGNYLVDVRGVRGFDAARAILTKKGSPVAGVASRMTGKIYSYVKKSSISYPMGQMTGQTSFNVSRQSMIDALDANTALNGNHSLSFKEERGVKISVTTA